MAQYGKNRYGTSYFGVSSVRSGQYTSAVFSTGNTLSNATITVALDTLLKNLTYGWDDEKFISYETGWENGGTTTYGVKATIFTAARNVVLHCVSNATFGIATITIKRLINGTVTSTNNVDINLASESTKDLSAYTGSFGEYQIDITKKNDDSKLINIEYFEAITQDAGVEMRTGYYDGASTTWGDWTALTNGYTLTTPGVVTQGWRVTCTSSGNNNKNRIQLRLSLASSDDALTPEVTKTMITSGDAGNMSRRGVWAGVVKFDPATFKEYTEISWVANKPSYTNARIQTQTSTDGIGWSTLSAPYTVETSQVRLRDTYTSGSITSAEINPENVIQYLTIDNSGKDWGGTVGNKLNSGIAGAESSITYDILGYISGQWVTYYTTPAYSMIGWGVRSSLSVPTKIKLRATLRRSTTLNATPYVNKTELGIKSLYSENKTVSGNVSLLDSATGRKQLASISGLNFTIPSVLSSIIASQPSFKPKYTILNEMNKAFIGMYWKSQESTLRTNSTSDNTDSLWVEIFEVTDNQKHYHYGSGTVLYPGCGKNKIGTLFTPKLPTSGTFIYKLESGWDSPGHGIDPSSDKNSGGRIIDLFWKSQGTGTGNETPPAGDPSTWTMTTESHDDMVFCKIYELGAADEVAWTSEQVIVHDEVINNGGGSTPTPVIVDSIILPSLDPSIKGIDDLFSVEIINNSVKCHGMIVPENRISIEQFDVIWDDQCKAYMKEVTRGTRANGKDVLPHFGVEEIYGVYENPTDAMATWFVGVDFELSTSDNSIDWAISGAGTSEPDAGQKYYVSYRYNGPSYASIKFTCDYTEPVVQRNMWTSSEEVARQFTVSPGNPQVDSNLPYVRKNGSTWEIDPSMKIMFPSGFDNNGNAIFDPATFEYTVRDNNFWVKTYVEAIKDGQYRVVGTLRNLKPRDNWMMNIHSGYYYAGSDRYYMFSEPVVIELDETKMPLSAGITYEDCSISKGAKFDGAESIVTYPFSLNFSYPGSVVMRIKPVADLNSQSDSRMFYEVVNETTGDFIMFRYHQGSLRLNICSNSSIHTTSYVTDFEQGTEYSIAAGWNNTEGYISVNGAIVGWITFEDTPDLSDANVIAIGNSYSGYGNACQCVIDELISFNTMVLEDELASIHSASSVILFNPSRMNFKCGFDGNISESVGSRVALSPVPKQRAPFIVQKSDGTPLRKVSFSDPSTGEYVTYNTEYVTYQWDEVVKSKAILVSYTDLEVDNFTTRVYNNKVIVGEPLSITNNVITMTLTDAEAAALDGVELKVVYQPKDCYIVENDGDYGSAFLRLGANPGEALKITYESGDSEYKFSEAIEMNPLLSPTHEGFIYITVNNREVSRFSVNVSPDHLLCSGFDKALVVIDTTDKDGNPTNEVNLTISIDSSTSLPSHGTLEPYVQSSLDESGVAAYALDSVSGRRIFVYTAPQLTPDQLATPDYEVIHILDEITGLGTEARIKLVALSNYGLGG